MSLYRVPIYEINQFLITVSADSPAEAAGLAREAYDAGQAEAFLSRSVDFGDPEPVVLAKD